MRDLLERVLLGLLAMIIVIAWIAMVGVFVLIVVSVPAPLIVKAIIALILGLFALILAISPILHALY